VLNRHRHGGAVGQETTMRAHVSVSRCPCGESPGISRIWNRPSDSRLKRLAFPC